MTFARPTFVLAAALAGLLCGCQPSQHSVVVDLEAVAKATGRDLVISRAVETATQQLNTQLLQAARDMEEELKKLQTQAGATPTAEQQTALRQARLQVQQNIQNNKLIAESARNRVRNEQVLLFRNEVKPIAAEIARLRKSNVVLIANEDVVWFAPDSDITGDVISRLRAQPAPSPSPVPSGEVHTSTNETPAETNPPPVPSGR